MKLVPLAALEGAIIKPGLEKHLEPLLYYRGAYSLGRAHRMYNFVVAAMLSECESAADMTERLAYNPDYSHLLGPSARPTHGALRAFYSRLLDNPTVADLTPGLLDFTKRTAPRWVFRLDRLPVVTHDPRARFIGSFRRYEPAPWSSSSTPAQIKGPRPQIDYPFMIHDGGGPEHALLRKVAEIVPRGLPPDMRADICQDLIVGVLSGTISEADLYAPMKAIMKQVQRTSPNKWGDLSLDQLVPGTDDLRLIDTI